MSFEIKRTELVWPGKYDEDGNRVEPDRVNLPFQVIERVNESRATREREKEKGMSLFDTWEGDEGDTFEDGWRNKLIWGDNKLVMSSLLKQFAGKIDLIYIDPPFAVGADFTVSTEIGDERVAVTKEQSAIEEVAYRDTWSGGLASYLSVLYERLLLLKDLIAPTGSIYVHLDPTVSHYVKSLLDEIFGREGFVNEIIWHYNTGGASSGKFSDKHDTLLFYGRDADSRIFNTQREPYREDATSHFTRVDDEGRRYRVREVNGTEYIYYLDEGRICHDVWDIDSLNAVARERVGYPTQKPEALLERVVEASSNPGGLVLDAFAGSGTSLAVAEKLGRRWIGIDLGRFAIHVSRKRLLDIEGCQPFEILNLGRYERSYWNVATFGEDLDGDGAVSLIEYLAFMLRLYGASPTSGLEHLHGEKEGAFVHIGAVDTPVTIGEVVQAAKECAKLKGTQLHVLGWEWEMGLHDLIEEEGRKYGVEIIKKQIPNEAMELDEAAGEGAVRFFELAALQVEANVDEASRTVTVSLDNFIIPNPELIPDEVREAVESWSDYVDYWAVDWNYSDDTFHQGWVTYRTRQDRSLELKSDKHTYEEPGTYRIMVKVIDIFGIDTSTIIEVTI